MHALQTAVFALVLGCVYSFIITATKTEQVIGDIFLTKNMFWKIPDKNVMLIKAKHSSLLQMISYFQL